MERAVDSDDRGEATSDVNEVRGAGEDNIGSGSKDAEGAEEGSGTDEREGMDAEGRTEDGVAAAVNGMKTLREPPRSSNPSSSSESSSELKSESSESVKPSSSRGRSSS